LGSHPKKWQKIAVFQYFAVVMCYTKLSLNGAEQVRLFCSEPVVRSGNRRLENGFGG
jgi:hypothetical protein